MWTWRKRGKGGGKLPRIFKKGGGRRLADISGLGVAKREAAERGGKGRRALSGRGTWRYSSVFINIRARPASAELEDP